MTQSSTAPAYTPDDTFRETRNVLDRTRTKHRESVVWVVPAVRDDLTAFVYTWVDAYGVAGAALSVFGDRLPEQIFEKFDGIEVARHSGIRRLSRRSPPHVPGPRRSDLPGSVRR